MAERRSIPELVDAIAQTLAADAQQLQSAAATGPTPDAWLEALARHGQNDAAVRRRMADIAEAIGLPASAHGRLLAYLRAHVGETVGKERLAGVAGIMEWARRVRELRVEEGWPISTDETRDDLRPGEYVLERPQPDPLLREQWQTAHAIRRQDGSGRSRLLDFFKAQLGRPVSKEQLRYVAQIQDHPRRVRELEEEGWRIESNLDNADLRPGHYVLTSPDKGPRRARQHIKLRASIIRRDGGVCRMCNRPGGSGRHLQVHHRRPVSQGGDNDPANLVTLCDACHAGVHALARADVADEVLEPDREPA